MTSKAVNDVIIVITGPSGSGKTTLEKNLLACFPFLFFKLTQFTTRLPRSKESQGDPYIFVSSETFDNLENNLVGVVKSGAVFKNKYGTLLDFRPNKFSTIILSEEGLDDLKAKVKNKQIVTIGLDINYDDLSSEVIASRSDRGPEQHQREKCVIKKCDKVFMNQSGKFTSALDIYEYLLKEELILEN